MMKLQFIAPFLMLMTSINPAIAQWVQHPTGITKDLYAATTLPQGKILITGQSGTFLRSDDSGKTFKNYTITIPVTYKGIHFSDSSTGFVCGENARIMKTLNGGISWQSKYVNTVYYLYDITFHNDSTGIAVGKNGLIVKTKDYGETWLEDSSNTKKNIRSVCITPSGMCIAVGDTGQLCYKSISNNSWNTKILNNKVQLHSVQAINDSIIYAAGTGFDTISSQFTNYFYYSSDTGKTFNMIVLSETRPLNHMYFADAQNGFFTGSSGTIVQTTNACLNSGKQYTLKNNTLNSIVVIGSNTCFATGDGGLLMKTVNNGGWWVTILNEETTTWTVHHDYNSLRISNNDLPIIKAEVYGLDGKKIHTVCQDANTHISIPAENSHNKPIIIVIYGQKNNILLTKKYFIPAY